MYIAIERDDGGTSIMTLMEGADLQEEINKWEDCGPWKAISHKPITIDQYKEIRQSRPDNITKGAIK